jgi:hypothetical protein
MDLRSEAIYALQQPYIRLHNPTLMDHKKFVKKVMKEKSRALGAATVYTITNEMFDIIIPALKRQKVRQFVAAFWNARPPHKNFYLEWDHYYLCEKLGLLWELTRDYPAITKMICGVHSQALSHQKVTSVGKNYEAHECLMPPRQCHTFYVMSDVQEKVILSPQELNVFDIEMLDKWQHTSRADTAIGLGMFRAGQKLWPKWLDIPEEDLEKYDGLETLAFTAIPALGSGISIEAQAVPDEYFFDAFLGFEQVAYRVFVAAFSLLNFDWVTVEQEGITARGTKSVNTHAFPQHQHKTITINLPKDKAIAEFHKQKLRTRKFGTAEHTVRGHWRVYKKSGERVWIGEHKRGDEKYGTVHKDYVLTKRDDYLKPTMKRNDDARQRPSRIS